jgi:hypothetical protein
VTRAQAILLAADLAAIALIAAILVAAFHGYTGWWITLVSLCLVYLPVRMWLLPLWLGTDQIGR